MQNKFGLKVAIAFVIISIITRYSVTAEDTCEDFCLAQVDFSGCYRYCRSEMLRQIMETIHEKSKRGKWTIPKGQYYSKHRFEDY